MSTGKSSLLLICALAGCQGGIKPSYTEVERRPLPGAIAFRSNDPSKAAHGKETADHFCREYGMIAVVEPVSDGVSFVCETTRPPSVAD